MLECNEKNRPPVVICSLYERQWIKNCHMKGAYFYVKGEISGWAQDKNSPRVSYREAKRKKSGKAIWGWSNEHKGMDLHFENIVVIYLYRSGKRQIQADNHLIPSQHLHLFQKLWSTYLWFSLPDLLLLWQYTTHFTQLSYCRPQPLHTPVWTQMIPPQAGQVHCLRSCSRKAAIPASRITRRFSSGDSRSGYFDPYRVSFSMTSAQG